MPNAEHRPERDRFAAETPPGAGHDRPAASAPAAHRPARCPARTGLWLACGGLVVLAAQQILGIYGANLSVDSAALMIGAVAGYLITAAGIALSVADRRRGGLWQNLGPAQAEDHLSSTERATSGDEGSEQRSYGETARRMTASFLAWCNEELGGENFWPAFDQFVRELLTEHLDAVGVRCYRVVPGDERLRSLSQPAAEAPKPFGGALGRAGNLPMSAANKSARLGILGHVATTGVEYVAGEPTTGELFHQLAADGDEKWEWVFPVRVEGKTAGLVAIARLPAAIRQNPKPRRLVSTLVTLYWSQVALAERLRVAETTDKATGLLTRADFFQVAGRALAESYAESEPVVLVVLALEGLRRLDDRGRWSDRDALLEAVGELVRRRIRTDDLIGRFSDDRFVMLLRRLDSGLGRLIAAKVQSTAQERVAQLVGQPSQSEGDGPLVRVRVGVAGSGFEQRALEQLLTTAFEAVELARRQNLPLYCDLEPVRCGSDPEATATSPNPARAPELRDASA